MNDDKLSGILMILVPQIIEEIIVMENVNEDKAINDFYNSTLYADLENNETGLWHLSPKALYQLYCEERKYGKVHYPDEV